MSNGRCVWGDDQPAIPIQATFVQYKGKFTDKKLQLTLHSQVQAPLAMAPVHRLVCRSQWRPCRILCCLWRIFTIWGACEGGQEGGSQGQ